MRVTAIETITDDDDADLTDTERDIGITSMKVWPFDESLLDHPGTELRRTELGG